jgi:hypothetical protein
LLMPARRSACRNRNELLKNGTRGRARIVARFREIRRSAALCHRAPDALSWTRFCEYGSRHE